MNILSIIIILLILFIAWQTYNKIYNSLKISNNNTLISNNVVPILKNSKIKNKIKNKKKVKFRLPKKIKKGKVDLVFMDIGSDKKYYGKITIKLFDKIVPKTCKNFRELCKTKKYFNSPFHRIIKDFMIQGGDFTNKNGTGGMSIYGSKFEDENFKLKHDRPYLLSMANSGPNTNGSQFFITTDAQPHLDNKHVVFGEIINGQNIIDKLNNIETDERDRPYEDIKILNCDICKL